MLAAIPYVILFAGPFLLALLGRRFVKGPWLAFLIGLPAFAVAWLCVVTVSVTTASAQPILAALAVSMAAGFFEESSRYLAFRLVRPLRERAGWRSGIMYAIGHSGMESIIVGGTLILTVVVATSMPEKIPPETQAEVDAVLAMGFWGGLYMSVERLFVGLLIHACFTCVVLHAFTRGRIRFLFLAMLWHFAHDMVALNIGRVSGHWAVAKLWVLFIVIVYGWALLRLCRSLGEPASPATFSTGPSG